MMGMLAKAMAPRMGRAFLAAFLKNWRRDCNSSSLFSFMILYHPYRLSGFRFTWWYKKSARVCICYPSRLQRLWHVPIGVERATRSLTLYDMPMGARCPWDVGISYPWLPIVDPFSNSDTKLPDFCKPRTSVDKRLFIMSAFPPALPHIGTPQTICGSKVLQKFSNMQYPMKKCVKINVEQNRCYAGGSCRAQGYSSRRAPGCQSMSG